MSDDAHALGERLSDHPPSGSLARGWPASVAAGALLITVALGLVGWMLSDGAFGLRVLAGALAAGAFGAGMLKSGLDGRRTRCEVRERGLVVGAPAGEAALPYGDIREWELHVVPGLSNRYEADLDNAVWIVVHARNVRAPIPDQLADFRGIFEALEENVGAPTVIRHERRPSSP